MHEGKEFTTNEAADLTGMSRRNIAFYSGPAEVVTPAIEHPQQRGRRKLFSFPNLVQFAVVKILAEADLNLATVRDLVAFISRKAFGGAFGPGQRPFVLAHGRTEGKPPNTWILQPFSDATDAKETEAFFGESLVEAVRKDEVVVVVNVGAIIKRLDAQI